MSAVLIEFMGTVSVLPVTRSLSVVESDDEDSSSELGGGGVLRFRFSPPGLRKGEALRFLLPSSDEVVDNSVGCSGGRS